MMRAIGSLRRVCVVAVALAGALQLEGAAHGHESRPATLALRETSPGLFERRWSPALDGEDSASGAGPLDGVQLPPHCVTSGALVDCRPQGLVGDIVASVPVVVSIEWIAWSRGERTLATLSPSGAATLRVEGAVSSARPAALLRMAGTFSRLGLVHVLTGADHLLFIVGLVLLSLATSRNDDVASARRRQGAAVLATLSAFTVAHTITLVLATLDVFSLAAPAVEVGIALSLLVLAVSCARELARDSTASSAAHLIGLAFSFGLLHGLGFAGGLREVLPPRHVVLSLLFFNVGVEVGQVAAAGAAMVVLRCAWHRGRLLRELAVLGMGGAASFWTFERCAAFLRALLAPS